jgi:hypothetical protein
MAIFNSKPELYRLSSQWSTATTIAATEEEPTNKTYSIKLYNIV